MSPTKTVLLVPSVTLHMAATDTRIPVSTETRRELRIVKATEEKHSYDAAIQCLLDDGATATGTLSERD